MISIVIPCYNESDKLYNNICLLDNFLSENILNDTYEIILSNDGSKDNTLDIMNELSKKYFNIKLINNETNEGKGSAVRKGMLNASGRYVIFMDADLATDLSAINDSIKELDNGFDVVIGSRRIKGADIRIKQPIHRRFIGKSCSIITNALLHLNVEDTQCGFKCFKQEIINKVFSSQQIKGFAFDAEVLYISKLYGYSIKELPVIWRNAETTTVKAGSDSLKFFKQLFSIKSNKKFYLKNINN